MGPTQNRAQHRSHLARWLAWFGILFVFGVVLYVARPRETAVQWTEDLSQAQSTAIQTHQRILIEFYKPDAPAFLQMDREVFTRPEVRDTLANWLPVRVDVTRFRRTADDYAIDAWPTYVVLSANGRSLDRHVGTMSAEAFVAFIRSVTERPATTQPK